MPHFALSVLLLGPLAAFIFLKIGNYLFALHMELFPLKKGIISPEKGIIISPKNRELFALK